MAALVDTRRSQLSCLLCSSGDVHMDGCADGKDLLFIALGWSPSICRLSQSETLPLTKGHLPGQRLPRARSQ